MGAFDGLVKKLSESPQQRKSFLSDLSTVLSNHGVDVNHASLKGALAANNPSISKLQPGTTADSIVITSSHTIGGKAADSIVITSSHTIGSAADTVVITSSHTIAGSQGTRE